MAIQIKMFLFLFKSKYRRKDVCEYILCVLLCVFMCGLCAMGHSECTDSLCSGNGVCNNGSCICNNGWQGPSCQFCGGKVRLSEPSGTIHDGRGNYSTDVKCSWLIEATPNSSVRLRLEEFATECGWDHLYIFDGDSVSSPLLAVFSGLMYKDDYGIRRVPEVVAHSGSALLHFYSDVAYNMTGFNVTYKVNSCPSLHSNVSCSGNGVCIDGVCTCNAMYDGDACESHICPNGCSEPQGYCNREQHRCICKPDYKGDDCSQLARDGYWEVVKYKDSFTPVGSASHGAVVFLDSMYVIGGESFGQGKMTYIYDFTGKVWETLHMEGKHYPSPRYGHSVALFGDKIYLYGGVLEGGVATNELWALDVSSKKWENITVRAEVCSGNVSHFCGPLRSAGHTATVLTRRKSDRMLIIFGHSPVYGYLNTVQEFHFGTRDWQIIKTNGHPVKGGYGHSAALDPYSEKIYVYGGFKSDRSYNPFLSNHLFSYDPNTYKWTLLLPGPSSRYLHTATFLRGGLMLVFGGNTHNDTVHSYGAKCYSGDMLAYDVKCDSWQVMQTPPYLRADLARFGHSAVTFKDELYIYGGFDGIMRNDMIKYGAGTCYANNVSQCVRSGNGIKCVWDRLNQTCLPITAVPPSRVSMDSKTNDNFTYTGCSERGRSDIHQDLKGCKVLTNCMSCLTSSYSCEYNAGGSEEIAKQNPCTMITDQSSRSNDNSLVIRTIDECPASEDPFCIQLHSCQACSTNPACTWGYENGCRASVNTTFDEPHEPPVPCATTCSEFTSCHNCTDEECIWCQNEGRCVDKNAYTASFPYGQCREWTTSHSRCRSDKIGKPDCEFYRSCGECQTDPECGWCDDGSKTGLGTCMRGGSHVSANSSLNMFHADGPQCPPDRWFFTTCPDCQCNGHSMCHASPSKCDKCTNLTTGDHCEKCKDGYHGSPINGGSCAPCDCSNHGISCNSDTGRCFCTTKGIIGDRCEKCDTANHYHGDPLNGSCFYDLKIDYQFTFNLSKKDDRHYNQINFRNSPTKSEVDADFSITCSAAAKMNITIKTVGSPEKVLLSSSNCSVFRSRFTKSDHNFGVVDNITQTTFYVYVYDFKPPLWIVISFSQYPKLNLQQFFITFSTCFLLLLLIAAILWKIKQKYDMYRRRQRLFVELEQMASRPSSQVLVEVEERASTPSADDSDEAGKWKKRKKVGPSPIALEPCIGNRAAVLSLLVRMPMGDSRHTPPGQSGFAIASALVTLGNPRTVSLDPPAKSDCKSKSRKGLSNQHPESCV